MADSLPSGSPLTSFLVDRCEELTAHASNPVHATLGTTISISVNVSGLVALRFARSTADVTRYMLAGVDYPWRVTHIRIAGTDAAVITGKIHGGF
jgi:hypothetical protein